MSLDYGAVRDYKDRGFGFLQSQFHGRDVFFHIKKVKDPKARETLDACAGGYSFGIQFWYTVERTSKGSEASQIWLSLKEVPSDVVEPFASSMVSKCRTAWSLDAVELRE